MRDDHVCAAFDCLVHGRVVNVERDHDTADFLRKAPDEEPGVVPILGEAGRRDAFEGVHYCPATKHKFLLLRRRVPRGVCRSV